jgi:hypothetical protein
MAECGATIEAVSAVGHGDTVVRAVIMAIGHFFFEGDQACATSGGTCTSGTCKFAATSLTLDESGVTRRGPDDWEVTLRGDGKCHCG